MIMLGRNTLIITFVSIVERRVKESTLGWSFDTMPAITDNISTKAS